jgi:hypothetical protein
MAATPKQALLGQRAEREHPVVQLGLLCAAGLLVSILLLSYGIDLSPGLF